MRACPRSCKGGSDCGGLVGLVCLTRSIYKKFARFHSAHLRIRCDRRIVIDIATPVITKSDKNDNPGGDIEQILPKRASASNAPCAHSTRSRPIFHHKAHRIY